ncbi:MAG: VPDSG-CTERM sorting domain-containing protein [Verrucomicrobiota bacterium]
MKLKSILKTIILMTVVACAPAVQAADPFINGVIQMGIDASSPNSGFGVTLDNSDLGLATQVTSWAGAIVINASNDFSGTVGQAVNFPTPWIFANSYTPFWTVGNFSFDLTSSWVSQSSGHLLVEGTGMLHAPGFSDTPGFWSFAITGPQGGANGQFSWSSSTNSVPDGGTTIALLGLSLLGLHGIRRKFAQR